MYAPQKRAWDSDHTEVFVKVLHPAALTGASSPNREHLHMLALYEKAQGVPKIWIFSIHLGLKQAPDSPWSVHFMFITQSQAKVKATLGVLNVDYNQKNPSFTSKYVLPWQHRVLSQNQLGDLHLEPAQLLDLVFPL